MGAVYQLTYYFWSTFALPINVVLPLHLTLMEAYLLADALMCTYFKKKFNSHFVEFSNPPPLIKFPAGYSGPKSSLLKTFEIFNFQIAENEIIWILYIYSYPSE